MNDTGANQQIDNQFNKEHNLDQVDRSARDDIAKAEEEAQQKQWSDYRDPSVWWFSSTGAPLVAGAFGPLASAFNICALARSWRVFLTPGEPESYGERIPDPAWLLAINGVSLFFAIAANMALLLNMSQRVSFKPTQVISTVGFAIAGILLVAIVAAFGSNPTNYLPINSLAAPRTNHALSGAFYYAIQAAVLYLVMTFLMCMTSWGVFRGHFKGGFRLTIPQRTLMLQTMFFVMYIMVGALIYSHIEGWEFLDALYWVNVTVLTIGFGSDFAPSTHAGRSLLMFFAIGGIIMIGLVIGSIRTLILDRGKRKLSARILEKKRMRAINSINPRRQTIRVGAIRTMKFDNDELNQTRRRELEFRVMRSVQEHAERDRKWMALAMSTTAGCVLWFIGAVVFYCSERNQDWSYFDSLYFCYVALLTIGYGDLYPESNSGKAFFVIWTLLAVPTLTILISDMSDTVISGFSELTGWLGSITLLPGDSGFRATIKLAIKQLQIGKLDLSELNKDTVPGALEGASHPYHDEDEKNPRVAELVDNVAAGLAAHLEDEELMQAIESEKAGDPLQRDIHFYHVVLAREVRMLMRHLVSSPPKKYSWQEWEYYLKLMNNIDLDKEPEKSLIPKQFRKTKDVGSFKTTGKDTKTFTWLGENSPLLDYKSESEWILERLGTTLERELHALNEYSRSGFKDAQRPPVSLSEMMKRGVLHKRKGSGYQASSSGSGRDSGQGMIDRDVEMEGTV